MRFKSLSINGFLFKISRLNTVHILTDENESSDDKFFFRSSEIPAIKQGLITAESMLGRSADFVVAPFHYKNSKDAVAMNRLDTICMPSLVPFKKMDQFRLALDEVEAKVKNDITFRVAPPR